MSSAEPSNDSIWKNRGFVLLFVSQVVSLLGSGATTIALSLLAYDMGGASATAVLGNALMLRIVAFLIFSAPAGILADRFPRKRILIAADLLRAALLLTLPFVTSTWQIYALVFVLNAVTAFFTPAFEATLPSLVGGAQLVRALAISRVAVDVEAIAAPAVAALVVAVAGPRSVFQVDALTYIVSAFFVLGATIPPTPPAIDSPADCLLTQLTHGTRVILREPSLRFAVMLSLAEALAGACAIVGTVAYVREVLDLGESMVAWAMGAVGVGSSVTALLVGRWVARRERSLEGISLRRSRHAWSDLALRLGAGALCVAILPGALAPTVAPFIFLWFLNGAGQALVAIASATRLAEHTEPGERGRVYAAHFALTHAGWLVAYPAVGHAASRWGAANTFTGAGVAVLVVSLVAALSACRGRGSRSDLRPRSGRS